VPTRKPLRLPYFDYATDGFYFVTTCTHDTRCLFGRVEDETVVLSPLGELVDEQIRALPDRVAELSVDAYVVMPNHVHAILVLSTRARQASHLHLGHVVAAFKSGSAREINRLRGTPGAKVWQRGYHDHVVRDEEDLERLREYVSTNPVRWARS
jgi:putative transposase